MYSVTSTRRGIWVMTCIESCAFLYVPQNTGDFILASGLLMSNVLFLTKRCSISSMIWYKASSAWAQKAQQLKYGCRESRDGENIHGLNTWTVATWTSFQPAVPCDSVLCLWLAIDSKTHRFSPSQCLLAAASNPLRLPLVHGAGEAASLVRAIPSLTASHLNRPEAHHHPSQQSLSQLPRSHRSAIPPPESLLCWCSLRDSSLYGPDWAAGPGPGSRPNHGVHSTVRARQRKKGY